MRKALMCFALTILFVLEVTGRLCAQTGDGSSTPKSVDEPTGLNEVSSAASFLRPSFDLGPDHTMAAVPGGYPAAPLASASSDWQPTHFEIMGLAQWKSASSNAVVSTGPYTVNLNSNLGFGGLAIGPLVRFVWKPGFTLLGAKSNVRVEYGQIVRSQTHSITTQITFEGQVYAIDTQFKTQVATKSFQAAWSPEWGNDRLRVGPYISYQRLDVDFRLTNETPGAPPPVTRDVPVPNNVAYVGGNFEASPVKQVNIYGWVGAIPCCGGGWHAIDSEVGVKYYVIRSLSVIAGYRYSYLKRDFNLPSSTVGSVTTPQISGFLKFPGGGPMIGLSYRF